MEEESRHWQIWATLVHLGPEGSPGSSGFGIVRYRIPVVTDSELACSLPCGTTIRAFLPLPIEPLRLFSGPAQSGLLADRASLSTRLLP